MFAKDTQRKFSQAIVHSGAFRADGALIVDSLDSKGNIQDQIDDAMAFIKRDIHCALVITPGKVDHDPMWDYPLEAVRETLANALCHRDYGAPYDIQVKIFEDSLCISSPGQLPFDMPMEFLMKPTHPSRPRNKIIAQAFFDMGIIERYGSGIKRIKGDCDKNGNPYPEWSDRYGEFATTYRPRVANGEGRMDDTAQRTTQSADDTTQSTAQTKPETARAVAQTTQNLGQKRDITLTQRKILDYLHGHPAASRRELAETIGNVTEDGVKYNLARLQVLGLLKRVGPDFGGHWEVVGFEQ